MRLAALLVAVAALLGACATTAPERSRLELIDLTDDFAEVWDRTRDLDDAARIAAFKAHFEPIVPGFYSHVRHGAPEERFNGYFLKALNEFPEKRSATAGMARRFAELLRPAERSFEREFGPLTGFRPIYLVDSLGEFDGGMRTLAGKGHLMFGADVMARLYADKDVRPFFHHELFHLHHSRTFQDCPQVWCNLWSEGLATYVAHRLNPAASDAELLLTEPEPLRAAVESHRAEAVCTIAKGLDSEDGKLNKGLFSSGRLNARLPGRFGYYVGYLVAGEAARGRSLVELADLPNAAVRPLVESSLKSLATCPA